MTAEEESRETKQKQHEGRHEARFLVYIVMKVKPLRVGGLLATHMPHGSKQRKMTLSAAEFLRRFAQHILPRGFVRIRQYGFLANRCRAANLTVARQLLTTRPQPSEACSTAAGD